MIWYPEELTPIHEKWLKQLFNMDKAHFTELCYNNAPELIPLADQLFELGAAEMERLYESNEGHSEKECVMRDLSRIITFFLDGQPDEDYIIAHDYSIFNKEQIQQSTKCGCFCCVKIFDPSEITEWCDFDEDTPLCPYCGIDAVLGDASGFEISEAFLKKMQSHWFS